MRTRNILTSAALMLALGFAGCANTATVDAESSVGFDANAPKNCCAEKTECSAEKKAACEEAKKECSEKAKECPMSGNTQN